MGTRITIKIEGEKKVIRALRRAGDALENWRKEMNDVSDLLLEVYAEDVFESEGQIIGEAWEKLNQPYKDTKRIRFPGRGTLEASGAMRGAFRAKSGRTFAMLDNPTEYLGFHQRGTSKMPRRVIFKLAARQKREITNILEDGLKKKMRIAFAN